MDIIFFNHLEQERVDQVQIEKWRAMHNEYVKDKSNLIKSIHDECPLNIPKLEKGTSEYNIEKSKTNPEILDVLQDSMRPFRVRILENGSITLSW